jgi:hypothetical protein
MRPLIVYQYPSSVIVQCGIRANNGVDPIFTTNFFYVNNVGFDKDPQGGEARNLDDWHRADD